MTGVIGLPVNNGNDTIGTVTEYDSESGVATITLTTDIPLPDPQIYISSRKQNPEQGI